MVDMPIRNKSKDNPYTLGYDEVKKIYTVEFDDGNHHHQLVEISEEVYKLFNKFELEDISQIHKYRKHIEHSELYEETLEHRMVSKSIGVECIVEQKLIKEELKNIINMLSDTQKRRIIKYYFYEKNEYEIAYEENTTQQAINKSLQLALEKLKKMIKY